MSEWTKGPWETDDNMGVWATGGGMVGQFFHVSMGITLEQAEANARLAAAAPTMAEALEALVVEYGERAPTSTGTDGNAPSVAELQAQINAQVASGGQAKK